MQEEQDTLIDEEKKFETKEDFWHAMIDVQARGDANEVELFFLHRPKKFMNTKLLGEDEVMAWLKEEIEEKLGRPLMVELNEKGIIVPK